MKKFLALILASGMMVSSALANETKVIAVNGIGEKSLDPNMVTLTLEVWSRGATAKQAQQMAANSFKTFKQATEKQGIRKEDVRTENYNLSPDYEYDQKTRQNKITGFRVSHSLTVVLRKVEDVGSFIDSLTKDDKKSIETGVNVNSIAWDSDKRSEVEGSALADAVKSARAKAEEIAKAAGVKIKGVYKISHSSQGSGPVPVFRNMSMMKGMAMESASTELPSGQIKIRVEVVAEYEI